MMKELDLKEPSGIDDGHGVPWSRQLRPIGDLRLFVDPDWARELSQEETAKAFSDKWEMADHASDDYERFMDQHRAWYLELYGFENESEFARFLSGCPYVLDAGAGTCGKGAWMASLSPSSHIICADVADCVKTAAKVFADRSNMTFAQCDIANLPFTDGAIDYVSCDQVIHHTPDPSATFSELCRVLRPGRDFSCYVYRKKALPRELIDEDFRSRCRGMSHEELLELSEQITELGKRLSKIDVEFDVPDIPALGIKAGRMTPQRFLYWNFLKCYWNEEQGQKNSMLVNYDWYAPSLAFRYTEEEFKSWAKQNGLDTRYFHEELACYSARFSKPATSFV
jgi:ubiquinone/menaquinone biosynthesis C-methylase UbiE